MRFPAVLVLAVFPSAALAAAPPASDAKPLEVVPLRHRTADDIRPRLLELAPQEAAIAGAGDQIFVRGTAEEIGEVREAVRLLDAPPRDLRISIRQVFGRRRSE